jgi:hypothetical protein
MVTEKAILEEVELSKTQYEYLLPATPTVIEDTQLTAYSEHRRPSGQQQEYIIFEVHRLNDIMYDIGV